MIGDVKNGSLELGDARMDYIRFGSGSKNLIMLPGLGDGLRSVKGAAAPMAMMYRCFARDFTVWAFSRKEPLPAGYTTRDMARDQAGAMELLEIHRAGILGVSMGGMIAQHLAADFPEKVERLILAVTAPCANPVIRRCIGEWVAFAKADDHAGFMDSNLRLIYSEEYYRKNKWMAPVVGKLTKPKSYDRFFIQADACLTHDARDSLERIQAPTLVICGEKDAVLGAEPSRQLADRIPGALLHVYPQWGHSLYEEAPDFNDVVHRFLTDAN